MRFVALWLIRRALCLESPLEVAGICACLYTAGVVTLTVAHVALAAREPGILGVYYFTICLMLCSAYFELDHKSNNL